MPVCLKLVLGGAVVMACSIDEVTFTLAEPPVESCATPGDEDGNGVADCDDPACAAAPGCQGSGCEAERCDGMDNDCNGVVDDREAIGATSACAAASCVEIRDENPASASGVWWVDPTGGDPFQVYCDQTTDGGGWGIVWRNHGGAKGGEESNAALLARAGAGSGDAIVLPLTASLASAIHQKMYDAYWASPDREWIKITKLWNAADELVNEQHIRVEMRRVTMQSIFAAPTDRCFPAADRMRVVVNGTVSFGETNLINHYVLDSFGLASTGNNDEDLCGQPASNLIDDPAPGSDSLYRLDGGGSTNAIRHLFSYAHTATGRDTSRCLYACWQGALAHHDGWIWAVR